MTTWNDNAVQFPRLLAEIMATQDLNLPELAASMDLSIESINELFDRADAAWEAIKNAPLKATSAPRQWQQFRVPLERVGYRSCSVFVNAFTAEEAREKALAKAGDQDFSGEYDSDITASAAVPDDTNVGNDVLEGHPKLEVLTDLGYDIDEDSDQPGLWIWTAPTDGCEISYDSAVEALEAAWTDAVGQTMGILNLSSEDWDALSFEQQKTQITETLAGD